MYKSRAPEKRVSETEFLQYFSKFLKIIPFVREANFGRNIENHDLTDRASDNSRAQKFRSLCREIFSEYQAQQERAWRQKNGLVLLRDVRSNSTTDW